MQATVVRILLVSQMYPGRAVGGGAAGVVWSWQYRRRGLEARLPGAVGKTEVISSGVDLERFAVAPAPDGPTSFLCTGSLTERKNVVRLADAFAQVSAQLG